MTTANDANENTTPQPPKTLTEAHQALARIRPKSTASLEHWLAYYQRSAALYAEIAEIDRGHHHEALYWAEHERERANEIKVQISTQLQPGID
jgi:hypothetical protein